MIPFISVSTFSVSAHGWLLWIYVLSFLGPSKAGGNVSIEPMVTQRFFDIVNPPVQDAISRELMALNIPIPPQKIRLIFVEKPVIVNNFVFSSWNWGPNSGAYFENGKLGYRASFTTTITIDYVTSFP
jgi:hypothetical protein